MKTLLVVIYILVFIIVALILFAITQIKLLGMKVKRLLGIYRSKPNARQIRKICKTISKYVTTRASNIFSRSGKNIYCF